jgi:peroxiredoxin
MAVKVGEKAPEFALFDTEKKPRSLRDLNGKSLVLAFFPGAFTGVCTKEMCTFRDSLSKFSGSNAQVVGISVDAPFANKAFAEKNNLQFPILSDYSRETSKKYGGTHENFAGLTGYSAAKRAAFVVDRDGVVQYAWVSEDPGVEPNYDEIAKAVAKIS